MRERAFNERDGKNDGDDDSRERGIIRACARSRRELTLADLAAGERETRVLLDPPVVAWGAFCAPRTSYFSSLSWVARFSTEPIINKKTLRLKFQPVDML